jgi:hypothetical protein
MMSLHELVELWNNVFHDPIPVTTIAIFRVLFGCILTINAFLLVVDYRKYFGPDAVLSIDQQRRLPNRLTLFNFLSPTNRSAFAILALHIVACITLSVGLMTRTSAAIVFVTMVSFCHRNPCVVHSGDTVLKLITFLLVFSPAGKAFSIDSMLDAPAVGIPTAGPWCQRLMQIQIAIVYLRTAYWKLQGRSWRAGTAAYYATQLTSYRRCTLPACLQNIHCAKIATWLTLLIESSLGTLVWIDELRYPTIVAGVMMHLGLEIWLNVQLFGWTMMVCLILFV